MAVELTSAVRKMVKSLGDARHRREEGLFVAEGEKCVFETIDHFTCRHLFATHAWAEKHPELVSGRDITMVTSQDIQRMSQLQTPQPVIAVYEMPRKYSIPSDISSKLAIALDRVQNPGNLGTIMRIADWFGIDTVIASVDTVDVFNPKVVQATMGSIARVSVFYTDLPATLRELGKVMPVYGTALCGKNIYAEPLTANGIIVMGNEGQGMSDDVRNAVTHGLFIPPFPSDVDKVESLNVSMATAVVVSEFRRRIL